MAEHRVLLTGGSGFLGSHIFRALTKAEVEIAVVTHVNSVGNRQRADEFLSLPTSNDAWKQEALDFRPTHVVHAATRFQVNHDGQDIRPMIRANVELGTELLEIGAETNAQFLTFSSFWQQYEGRGHQPMNLYAATKQAFDEIADYFRNEGLDLARLTLFDVYGPGDTRSKLVPLLIHAALSGEPLDASSGMQLIDLTYIDDVVDAVMQVLFEMPPKEPADFVVRSGARKIRDVVDTLGQVTGSEVPVCWGARPDRPREMREDWDVGVLLPDWSPKVTLPAGLERVWNAARNETDG